MVGGKSVELEGESGLEKEFEVAKQFEKESESGSTRVEWW